jgi:hypothetical protein
LQTRLQTLGSLVPVLATAWLPPDRLSSLILPCPAVDRITPLHLPPIPRYPTRTSRTNKGRLLFLRGHGFPRLGYSLAFSSGVSLTRVILVFPRDLFSFLWRSALPSTHTDSLSPPPTLRVSAPIPRNPATNITPFSGVIPINLLTPAQAHPFPRAIRHIVLSSSVAFASIGLD